jgi:hypothetical protein
MRGKGQALTLFLLLILTATTAAVVGVRSGTQKSVKPSKTTREGKVGTFPIVDFDKPEPTDKALREQRQTRSKRYDRSSGQKIEEPSVSLAAIRSSGWADRLSAIPARESDAVVIATVTNAAAHLSNDKTAVYSEFDCRIDEVLKAEGYSVPIGSTLVVQRFGGVVRFRSGLTIMFETAGQGMPTSGRRYVFFLKQIEDSGEFRIVTAYDVTDSTIAPLDGSVADESTRSYPFDEYQGCDVASFLDGVKGVISQMTH